MTTIPARSRWKIRLKARQTSSLRRRQKIHFVLGRDRDDVLGLLFFHRMDRPEQVVELARRRHPEETFHRLVRFVEDAVRQFHRQADQTAGGGNDGRALEYKIEAAFEHVDEFVLRRVDVRRHESAGRKRGVPGKRTLAHRLRHVGLAENIPDDAVKAGAGFGYSRCEFLHRVISLAKPRLQHDRKSGYRFSEAKAKYRINLKSSRFKPR